MPRWAHSIRFRLSLAYALAVFTAGAVMIAIVVLWQTHQLSEPIMLNRRTVVFEDSETGQQFETQLRVMTSDDLMAAFLDRYEREVDRESLRQLRRASFVGLGALFVVAFGSGWLLAGWTLRPMGRMAAVAREISATELSRRIGLRGPDDELKDLADTFDEMLDRLQASFEDQRRFVQDASHELRNPLAVTQANLELVIDDPSAEPEELREAARIAHGSAGRLSAIVDDLVAQAREGVPSSHRSTVDLGSLVEDLATELRAGAAARDLTLEVVDHSGPDSGLTIKGDEAAIRRAVMNLAANAIRLAPGGSTITISTGLDGDCAAVSVADEGPGIEATDHDAVFERFWRGDTAGQGLGLGLSIVRQVAQRHGGTVGVESAPGVGSTFTLRLPMPVTTRRGSMQQA